jgi:CheY-like chemotaxis protein
MMLTSSGKRGDAVRCRELGMAAYLVKPISSDELKQALLRALDEAFREPDAALITRHTLHEEGRALRILVAEDNPVNQRLIVRLLQKLGHLPQLTGNGREAVALAQSSRFDLVIMDVQMPEMDGFAATAAIREGEKISGEHVPIIAMTAHAFRSDERRCREAGMDGYLSKPVDFERLREVLEQVSSRAHAERETWNQAKA